mmetsp:Transcript_6142/g.12029  ORF Transcript_6142/g.12029 Transcript_6142/m.12029 type:complete len:123 (-) Transcript_6142:154-522(-)
MKQSSQHKGDSGLQFTFRGFKLFERVEKSRMVLIELSTHPIIKFATMEALILIDFSVTPSQLLFRSFSGFTLFIWNPVKLSVSLPCMVETSLSKGSRTPHLIYMLFCPSLNGEDVFTPDSTR